MSGHAIQYAQETARYRTEPIHLPPGIRIDREALLRSLYDATAPRDEGMQQAISEYLRSPIRPTIPSQMEREMILRRQEDQRRHIEEMERYRRLLMSDLRKETEDVDLP